MLKKEGIYLRDCSNKTALDQHYVRIAARIKKENQQIARSIAKELLCLLIKTSRIHSIQAMERPSREKNKVVNAVKVGQNLFHTLIFHPKKMTVN